MTEIKHEIKNWEEIRSNYNFPDILLGNGFSMNLSDKFGYKSLFETFIAKTSEPFTTLFKQFGTTNFELILSNLHHALKVNEILNLETDIVRQVILALKNGLIEAIKEIHPKASEIDWERLKNITLELQNFNDIFSTNYDLYLYHIIMLSKDSYEEGTSKQCYQDYFWGRCEERGYTQFVNYQTYKDMKHVYYLHGALFIFNRNIFDLKILRNSVTDELIDVIAEEIHKGHFPLFVTEGSANDKIHSIHRSNYLYFCMNKFRRTSRALVIYGNSLSDFDEHIVRAVFENPRELIISLYTNNRSEHELKAEMYNILRKFPRYTSKIEFVDSSTIFPN